MKFRNWRRRVKAERATAVEQAERGEVIQTVPVSADEIPFGVKALEEEPAIEGVWNARTATPLHTPPGSRGSSPRFGPSKRWQRSQRGSSVSSISKLDIEEQPKPATQTRKNHIVYTESLLTATQFHQQLLCKFLRTIRLYQVPEERNPTLLPSVTLGHQLAPKTTQDVVSATQIRSDSLDPPSPTRYSPSCSCKSLQGELAPHGVGSSLVVALVVITPRARTKMSLIR